MSTGPSHDDLLARVATLRREAASPALDDLRRTTSSLVDELNDHLVLEEPDLRALPTFTARLVRRGQERLVQELLVLAMEAEVLADPHQRVRLADEFAVRLAVQVDAERRAFGGTALAGGVPRGGHPGGSGGVAPTS